MRYVSINLPEELIKDAIRERITTIKRMMIPP